MSADLIELSNALSGWGLFLAGRAGSPEEGAALADEILRTGAAYAAWLKIVAAQGGDTRVFEDPAAFHQAAGDAGAAGLARWVPGGDGLQGGGLGGAAAGRGQGAAGRSGECACRD